MTEKIYEYKKGQDWFIGRWSEHIGISGVGNFEKEEYDELSKAFTVLFDFENSTINSAGFSVTVIKKNSDYQLISFIANMISSETGRILEVTMHQEAVLISEGPRLLSVYLPKTGVELSDFFGQADQPFVTSSILIATHNEGKTKEFREMFGRLGIAVENLNNYPELPEVEETGMTFEENARLKAETISKLTGKMVLSDDSGLEVNILGGLPGVWSARFSGPDATDEKNNSKLLHELGLVFDIKDRSAQFHTTLVVASPDKESLVVEAQWAGYIATEAKGENGFGYDPLFIVGETGRHAAELSAKEKNTISHRGQAVKKLMEVFPKWLAGH